LIKRSSLDASDLIINIAITMIETLYGLNLPEQFILALAPMD
jgi:hypothetical protein